MRFFLFRRIINRRLLICDTLTNLQLGAGLTTSIEIELGESLRDHQRTALKLPFVRSVQGKDSKYIVEVENPTINVPNLVRALVDSEAKVYVVRPKTKDLEAIYLQCVSQKGVDQ